MTTTDDAIVQVILIMLTVVAIVLNMGLKKRLDVVRKKLDSGG
jgi:hypothetical protein